MLPAGVTLLPAFADAAALHVLEAIRDVLAEALWRRMLTPGGRPFSVDMSNCGAWGWVSDSSGYRYTPCDPLQNRPWPAMPAVIVGLAEKAAAIAGYPGFCPDACLINRYAPGAMMGLHQDRDEDDTTAPIVSLSFGLPATFLFGGLQRSDATQRITLAHGDAIVWGGAWRLAYHGILPLKVGTHAQTGAYRINLTVRRARKK